jgi:hypothetical protein
MQVVLGDFGLSQTAFQPLLLLPSLSMQHTREAVFMSAGFVNFDHAQKHTMPNDAFLKVVGDTVAVCARSIDFSGRDVEANGWLKNVGGNGAIFRGNVARRCTLASFAAVRAREWLSYQ